MPIEHPKLPLAPQPSKIFFDPYNSSSTGHQVAPSNFAGTKGWHDSRSRKLAQQLSDTSGRGGARYLSDLVGAGSAEWRKDGRRENGDWEKGAPGLREIGWQDIRGMFPNNKKKRSHDAQYDSDVVAKKHLKMEDREPKHADGSTSSASVVSVDPKQLANKIKSDVASSEEPAKPAQIFQGLTLFLNGSTAPLVSDHKLKHLFVSHGGNSSIGLGRRTVTHIIVGNACGGGLAAGKFQKENSTVRGKSIKFVTAQWVLDSVEKGIRQPEGRYQAENIASRIGGSRQKSVGDIFSKTRRNE